MIIEQAKRLKSVKEYYFSRKLREITQMKEAGKSVLNLGIGSPDLPPSPEVIHTLQQESGKENVHAYQSYTGINDLREAFSDWYGQYFKVTLNPAAEILPLMGSKEGILFISLAFLNPGDGVLVPNPGYPTYTSVSNLVQANIINYPLDEANKWQPDFEMLDKMNLSNIKLMWVNYPNMPTGADGSKELFEKLVAFGKKHKILVCNDNPYSFVLNEEPKSILAYDQAKETAIELNSLSKSHNMAGWRIGMIAGAQDYIQTIIKVSSNVHSGMFLPLQKAAVEALRQPNAWYEQLNKKYQARRSIVYHIFDRLKCSYDKNQKGLFVWARIPETYENAETYSEKILQQAHVFVTPGFIFGSKGDRYLRISLCSHEETLEEARKRIGRIH